MSFLGRFAALFILIASVALAVWSQDPRSQGQEAVAGYDWSELMASMDKMHAAMASIQPSGNLDADFVRLMLPHHQGAIDMAKAELLNGKDPQMRRLAQEIITDQQSEIDLMQVWLKRQMPVSRKADSIPTPPSHKEN